jgi:RimJ/RimL family protein N-acetyltransferase
VVLVQIHKPGNWKGVAGGIANEADWHRAYRRNRGNWLDRHTQPETKEVNATLSTERLRLRHLRLDDLDTMYAYLGDAKTMVHYPQPFSREFVKEGIEKNLKRYRSYGYGLFGVELKETGHFIGDCGLVWQELDGGEELEVGYHFNRHYWGQGYAPEAAKACIDLAFEKAGVDHVISLIRPENVASRRVAEKNGLRIVRHVNWRGLLHDVWAITADDINHEGHKVSRRNTKTSS